METIKVPLGSRSYDILIASGILNSIGERLHEFGFSPRCAVISNPTVYELYGKTVFDSIRAAGFEPVEVIIPDGEEYKSLQWAEHIYGELLKARLDRSSFLIALGGGVIGDITGFVASTYMRGISFIQLPTTLLACVDSSVGGKTGVNHKLGKNMIGTFWQPSLVLIDTETLKTLPRKEFLAGIAEVIKYGIIKDRKFFEYLESKKGKILELDNNLIVHIIRRSCEIKADVVSKDERESGLRAILNYGHTIGHAIESVTGYTKYIHGEAVAIGMHIEAHLGSLSLVDIERIKSLIDSYGLPSELPAGLNIDGLVSAMEVDKKTVRGEFNFLVPESIGHVNIVKIERQKIIDILSK